MGALVEKLRHQWNLRFHYSVCPFGAEFQEAWNHRSELFSKWDDGIQTDAIGLYSVTPEKIAREIAEHVRVPVIVDAFCGIGGNAIAFAGTCGRVIAIDIDEARLQMAQHNAGVYKRDNITFIQGNFLERAAQVQADAVFLDPPWGGPGFEKKLNFSLEDFSPSGQVLLDAAFKYFPKVILRVPAQFDLKQLDGYGKFEVQKNFLHGRLISKTIYFD